MCLSAKYNWQVSVTLNGSAIFIGERKFSTLKLFSDSSIFNFDVTILMVSTFAGVQLTKN